MELGEILDLAYLKDALFIQKKINFFFLKFSLPPSRGQTPTSRGVIFLASPTRQQVQMYKNFQVNWSSSFWVIQS